jgi:hypothetical protein
VKVLDVVRARAVFITAQKRSLDHGVIDIKFASDEPDREFKIELG